VNIKVRQSASSGILQSSKHQTAGEDPMATIGQTFRALINSIKAPGDGELAQALPPAVAAERLHLLLSCGF
jgi:hypothetical protein